MRFVLSLVAVALLAMPVAAQHRGRRAVNGYHRGHSRPHHPVRRQPAYYPRGYGYGVPVYPTYGYPGYYSPYGYGYYPQPPVDFGLSTFLLRQQQDFGSIPLPTGYVTYGGYYGDYGPSGGYDDVYIQPYDSAPVPERPYYGRRSQRGSFGGDRTAPPTYATPRSSNKTKEIVVDGVPTLTSYN